MDSASLGDDISPSQRSKDMNFRFTDPVRFLFEHMQEDGNKSTSPNVSDDCILENSSGKLPETIVKNALSPSLKSTFQDLYSNDNVFSRVLPVADTDSANNSNSGANIEASNNIGNAPDNLPPMQNAVIEKTSSQIGEDETIQPSFKRSSEQSKPQSDTPSKKNIASLMFASSKLESVANSLSRHRVSNNATFTKREEQPPTSKPPVLKPPPFTKRLASRAFRRASKPPPPFLSSVAGRTPPHQSAPAQTSAVGNKPAVSAINTASKTAVLTNLSSPDNQIVAPVATAGYAFPAPTLPMQGDSEIPVIAEDIKPNDQHLQLVELCKKSDWLGVEALFKQFSKAGLPPDLADQVRCS